MSKETFGEYIIKSSVVPNSYAYIEALRCWKHQQNKLDQKDARIKELEEENKKMLGYKLISEINLKTSVKYYEQLKEANEVIDYYGDENNYADLYIGHYGLLLESDIDTCGKKAREYQAKYKGA